MSKIINEGIEVNNINIEVPRGNTRRMIKLIGLNS
jgi:hypothetical protein